MFKKIFLAYDGSDHSILAADKAIEIAKCTPESTIDVVYVVSGAQAKTEVLQKWNSIDVKEDRKYQIHQIEHKMKKAGISYKVDVLTGEPGPTLVEHINNQDYDVAVIGSRGLNTLQEMVLGSVSHKVAKRANCPVLIVK